MTWCSRHVRRVAWIVCVFAGCASPLTVAEPRDLGDAGPADDAGPPPPVFGDAAPPIEASDAPDEPPDLSDPPTDAADEG
jgi:hypothetical protein